MKHERMLGCVADGRVWCCDGQRRMSDGGCDVMSSHAMRPSVPHMSWCRSSNSPSGASAASRVEKATVRHLKCHEGDDRVVSFLSWILRRSSQLP